MKKNIKQVVVVLVALVCGLTANYAYSVFIGPTMNPPAGNPPLPIVEHIYKTDNSTVFYQSKGGTPFLGSLLDIDRKFKVESFLSFKNLLSGNPDPAVRYGTSFYISALTPENNRAEQQVCSMGTDGKVVLCPVVAPIIITPPPLPGVKIDWNNLAFNWIDTQLHADFYSVPPYHEVAYDCSTAINTNPLSINVSSVACVGMFSGTEEQMNPPGQNTAPYYEPNVSSGYWDIVNITTTYSTLQQQQIMSVEPTSFPLYFPSVHSCVGKHVSCKDETNSADCNQASPSGGFNGTFYCAWR